MNRKLHFYVLTFFLFAVNNLVKAQIWDTLSSGVFTDLKDIHFLNRDTGYAVGSQGGIIKTINGGVSWLQQNSGINPTIRGVYFVTPNYGFACADSGRILKTLDGGMNWIQQNSGTVNNLIDVHFASPKMGLVVGTGKVLFTNDSGNTWQSKTVPLLGSITLRSVMYTSLSTAWVCGDPKSGAPGVVYHSLDSGNTWTAYSNTSAPNGKGFNKVVFNSVLSGWLFGQNGIITHTIDSGKSTWSNQFSGTTFDFLGADYINGNLYAVGRSGIIVSSSNGGSLWTGQYSATSKQLWGVDFVNDTTGWACGDSGTVVKFKKLVQTKPVMLLQPNGSEVWQIGKKYNIIWYAPGISFLNIEYSLNSGQSWLTIANNVSATSGSYPWTISTAPSLHCLIRIRNAANLSVGDTSDGDFTIINTPTGIDYSVLLTATVQKNPANINISWTNDPNSTGYVVYKKLRTDTVWTQLISLVGNVLSYSDSQVNVSTIYEYKVMKATPLLTGTGYLYSGIEIPAVENRGNVLVLVDSTFSTYLASELYQFDKDLIGDGWQVVRKSFLPTVKDTVIKNFIKQQYSLQGAALKSVILIGSLPVPYSGNFAPDGHAERVGAQPCDAYYADVDGNWTDNTIQTTNTGLIHTPNSPGDGNWDQSTIPSDVELQVGRIDMHNLPVFSLSEKDLLKHYLNKNHRYRHKLMSVLNRSLLFTRADAGLANISAGGWRSQNPMFGFNSLKEISSCSNTNCTDLMDSLKTYNYLWTYAGDGGTDTSFGGPTFTSTYCAQDSIKSVFMQVWGSYFVEWNKGGSYHQNNLLRSIIGNKANTLVSVWAGRFPYWYFHPMALGESVGACARLNQNNTKGVYEAGQPSLVAGAHMALMGDPTLRLQMVSPVASLSAQVNTNQIQLSWGASPDANAGYTIYRSNSIYGTFTRLNAVAVSGLSFIDSFPLAGSNVYMVRTFRLETSASGTYFNLSQGIFDSIYFTATIPNFTVTASASSGGSISPSGTNTVTQGSSLKFSIIANTGYHIDSLLIDGVATTPDSTYTFFSIQSNHQIRAVFAINVYTIHAVTGANGVINPQGLIQVNYMGNQTFSVIADQGYEIDSVWVDQIYAGILNSYSFTQVNANHTLLATFKKIILPTFTINAIAGLGGTISPMGTITVTKGDTLTFSIQPNSGFSTDTVKVDGIFIGTPVQYTFLDIDASHSIEAIFRSTSTGVMRAEDNFEIEMFPNPADVSVTINAKGFINKVDLYSIQGKLILSLSPINGYSSQINVQQLSSGIYMIKLSTENAVVAKKLVVYK